MESASTIEDGRQGLYDYRLEPTAVGRYVSGPMLAADGAKVLNDSLA